MSESNIRTTGIGFLEILTIIFVVLKLNPGGHLTTPIENWSWWLVLSPFLLEVVVATAVLAVAGIWIYRDYRKK